MNRPRNPVLRWLLDTLLIPVAVLVILVEDVLWAGALALLRRVEELPPVQALRVRLERLPAAIVLPLFLVPEVLSHVAGFYATILLAQGRVVASVMMAVFVKGTSMLVLVWIYHCCEETLLAVPWFAWLHDKALQLRDWAKAQLGPIRERLHAALARFRVRSAVARVRVGSRFRAVRAWLTRKLLARTGDR